MNTPPVAPGGATLARDAMAFVLAGGRVYEMDYERTLQRHVASGADATVG